MTKVLGLDVGTNSLGWAITELDAKTGVYTLLDKGVCIFSEGVNRTKSGEEPMVKIRTNARMLRRHYYRRRLRKIELLKVLVANDFCPVLTTEQLDLWRYKKIYPKFDEFILWQRSTNVSNPYSDRYTVLTTKLDLSIQSNRYILGRALYHLAQRRGFLSNRKDTSSKDDGVVKEAIKSLDKDMSDAGCSYLGEFYFNLYREGKKIRTGSGYGYAGRINHYLKEFNAICDKQCLSDDLREALRRAIFFQRPLRSQKGSVGTCSYEKTKAKCPISHPRYEEYRMWAFINNIKIKTPNDEKLRNLSDKEIEKILPLFYRKSNPNFDFEDIAKKISGKDNYCHLSEGRDDINQFNYKMIHSVSGCPITSSLRSIFGDDWLSTLCSVYIKSGNKTEEQILNDVWHVLFSFDDNDKLIQWAKVNLQLDDIQAQKFAGISPKQGYASLSLCMINKLLPYLRQGYRYDEAVFFVGVSKVVPQNLWKDDSIRNKIIEDVHTILVDFIYVECEGRIVTKKQAIRNMLLDNYGVDYNMSERMYEPSTSDIYGDTFEQNGVKILGSPRVQSIKNPMAMRAMFRLRNLVNSLLVQGKIDAFTVINIEMARGLNDGNRRAAIERYQRELEKKNQESAKEIKKLYLKETGLDINPSETDILKYNLWIEQQRKCLYTGKEIALSEFIGSATVYDIEHTVPRSRGGDDSQMNKTLCDACFNREVKKTKLPSELGREHKNIMARIDQLGWNDEISKLEFIIRNKRVTSKTAVTKEAKDIAIRDRHFYQMKLDYLRGKLLRFSIVNVPHGFSNRQGVDIGIISKYAKLYLETVFRKGVYVVKGATTADFRKMWGLQDEYAKKERSNHVHHCIDAITISCIGRDAYAKWTKYQREKDLYNLGLCSIPIASKPWPTFTEDVKSIAEELFVSHYTKDRIPQKTRKALRVRGRIQRNTNNKIIYMQGDSARGSLHLQTFYGAIKRGDEVKYVVRKSLDSLTDSDIKNIVDDAVRECVENAIKRDRNALSRPICFNEEKGVYIKKVRVYATSVTSPILLKKHRDESFHEHKRYYHVVNESNYCMAIYEGHDKHNKIRRSHKVVNNLEAVKFYNGKVSSESIVPNVDSKQLSLKYLIRNGVMVLFYQNTKDELKNLSKTSLVKRLYKVIKMQKDGRITFKYHQEARNDEYIKADYEKLKGEKAPKLLTSGYSSVNYADPYPKLCISVGNMNMCVEGYDFELTVTGDIKFKF